MSMRMKTIFISAVALGGLLLSNGCSRIKGSHHDHGEHTRSHSVNWEFSEGRGVHLSAEGKKIIGIELADVEVGQEDNAATVCIPASALLTTARGDFVYVVNGHYFFRSPVLAGRRSDDCIEIRDGLFEGDRVVSHGVKQLWLIELQAINGGEACTDGH